MLLLEVEKAYSEISSILNYVVEVFNFSYEINQNVLLGYGDVSGADIQVIPGDYRFFLDKSNYEPQNWCWFQWQSQDVPSLFQREVKTVLGMENGQVRINFDVLLSAFYFLSSWEEVHNRQRDSLGRFPARESFLYKHNLLKKPIVNYYFEIVNSSIKKISDANPTARISREKKYPISCIITHDIDKCMTGWRENAFRSFLSGNFKITLKTIWDRIFSNDIWFNLQDIMDLEDNLNVKSAFYFIPQKRKYNKFSNADYDINSTTMRNLLKEIQERNFEIGIHHSLGTGWDQQIFLEDVVNFPVKPAGGRFHFLAMSLPESFQIIDNSNLSYDTTYGFAEEPGFRNGFCFPYPPFDHNSNKAHSFIQLPLMIMDWTFIGEKYLNLPPEGVYSIMQEIIDEVEKFNGMVVVLWHNSSFTGFKYRGWDKPFKWLIGEIKRRNGRFLKPAEIINKN